MVGIFLCIVAIFCYGIYECYKEIKLQDEEYEDGYNAALNRYRYAHSIIPFSNPQTSFEKGWNGGITTILDVIGEG